VDRVALALKNIVFTLLVPGTAAVYVPLLLARNRLAASGIGFWLAIALLIINAAIYARCAWDFAAFGRATPAPIDAPKKLVVRGLYRYSRNPIYVGVVTAVLGWALLFSAVNVLVYALCLALGFHLFVVLYEEPHLTGRFGEEYRAYCQKVGRWLPRVR
jgi:protein-S-isoprenylcysteine O-methyltransferase Ste14